MSGACASHVCTNSEQEIHSAAGKCGQGMLPRSAGHWGMESRKRLGEVPDLLSGGAQLCLFPVAVSDCLPLLRDQDCHSP